MSATRFDDLPQVSDGDEMRRVHSTAGLYFLNRSWVAHSDIKCMFVDPGKLVANPR